ncbi:MAG: PhoH family protein [Deltaproteobacteria bacterium]|nr:PhoH family protein [Deltaproteobacteria bacterium]
MRTAREERNQPPITELIFDDSPLAQILFGEHEQNLKIIEKGFGVTLHSRGNHVQIVGEPSSVQRVGEFLGDLYEMAQQGYKLDPHDIEQATQFAKENGGVRLKDLMAEAIPLGPRQKKIGPKSLAQKTYLETIRNFDLVFGVGPAGTGKTYLAMAMAVLSLMNRKVERIILARPAVEAGEKLGFLPGDLYEKVNPYLRPLYDALHDMMEVGRASRLIEQGVIEVAPLAFMRGRTLNDSFVILDEAQNTTSEQMKMFLTRLGFGSKAVVTGDITQIDLPNPKGSGLLEAREILKGIEGIAFVYFSERDVVRHPLVQKVIKAYEIKGRQL